jgi:hypothetical protein
MLRDRWVGSTVALETFATNITNWSSSTLGNGWPAYINQKNKPNTVAGKVPSALEIFNDTASFNNTNTYSPAPASAPPIQRMTNLWADCFNNQPYAICGRIRDVNALLLGNYQNYVNVYNKSLNGDKTWSETWGCTKPAVTPIVQTVFLSHLYGWSPWGPDAGCRSDVNLLWQTPGYNDPAQAPHDYTTVKREFDEVQYWFNFHLGNGDTQPGDYGQWNNAGAPNYGQFDPYVALVHGKEFMNAPYTYAYSVDDAVGNYQADGTGLILTVGGPKGLPNTDHVTREVQFTFGYNTGILPAST